MYSEQIRLAVALQITAQCNFCRLLGVLYADYFHYFNFFYFNDF